MSKYIIASFLESLNSEIYQCFKTKISSCLDNNNNDENNNNNKDDDFFLPDVIQSQIEFVPRYVTSASVIASTNEDIESYGR